MIGLSLATASPAPAHADNSYGMMVDAGLPSGVSAALTMQPRQQLRLHLGLGHNMLGAGVRGGASVRLSRGRVAPTLSVEAGQFGRTDAAWLGGLVGADTEDGSLREVSYSYGSGHVGLEFRGADATFFVEIGASSIRSDLYFEKTSDDSGVQMDVRTQSELDFWTATGRAGVLVWF